MPSDRYSLRSRPIHIVGLCLETAGPVCKPKRKYKPQPKRDPLAAVPKDEKKTAPAQSPSGPDTRRLYESSFMWTQELLRIANVHQE